MNNISNPIKSALALVVTLFLLTGGQTAAAQDAAHDHEEAKSCTMMAEGADKKECSMKAEGTSMEDCPMMAEGEECPMMQRGQEGHHHSAQASVQLSVAASAFTDDVQTIEISVGPGGYEPSELELKAGVTTHLVFTRTADGGCVNQVQIPDLGVEKTDLPLGEAVTIEVTPAEAGTYRFACGMNMVRGTILVKE